MRMSHDLEAPPYAAIYLVDDVMTRSVVSVRADTGMDSVAELMLDRAISGVPVVDKAGRLLGMVSKTDVVRESAESYLDLSAFSRSGLIKQLKFEGYSEKDATYGVDAQRADWNKQAAASAQSYLDMSSFSRQGLIDQLKFEGFTEEQAVFGVGKNGL